MGDLINFALIKEPLNWLTIFLMCAFALIALYLVFPDQGPPADSGTAGGPVPGS